MNAKDLRSGMTVYWTKANGATVSGTVQSITGTFATVQQTNSTRRPTLPAGKLRKQP